MNANLNSIRFLVAALACVHLGLMPPAATAADPAPGSILHLTNGGFVAGELRGSDDPKVLQWRSPLFARPLEFPLGAVKGVHYAAPAPPPRPAGEYCFELVNDDVLYGDLLGLTDDTVELNSARVGRVKLSREQVRRMYRWKGAEPVYLGPNGLAGWRDRSATPQWRDEGGHLLTSQAGASLYADLGIPEKAVIEVELSWQRRPDFVFALAVGDRDDIGRNAFHFEVWDNELVVVGESTRDADVASLQTLPAGEGHIRVLVYLDQKQRRLILLSPGGKPLATLNVRDPNPQTQAGVLLKNVRGDLRLEHLRVTRWDGQPPREARDDQARLHRTDGTVVYGRLVTFDSSSKQFTLTDGTTETRLAQDAIADIFLAPAAAAKAPADRSLRVVYRDGTRLTGSVTRIDDAALTLTCPGVTEPLRLPLADMRSLVPLRYSDPAPAAVAGKAGRLEMDGVSLKGRLVDGAADPHSSCLVWNPDLSLGASALRKDVSGRIVYRDPPQRPVAPQVQRPTAVNQAVIVNGGVAVNRVAVLQPGGQPVGQPSMTPVERPPSSGKRALHLRTGDTIPCDVLRMDEKGVTVKTSFSDASFIPHEKIKAVELVAASSVPGVDVAKRDRLLTLPRMQRDSPPTHLICSKNGDFLRGRILEMDNTRLRVEVRLDTREIPRDRVAQIIWLHADELTDGQAAPATPAVAAAPVPVEAPPSNRVQVVRADGSRLTFVAEKSDSKAVSGTSDVLGACRVELAEADQLLFGASIERSAAQLAYHQWKLRHAVDPKFVEAIANGSTDGGMTGLESALVGKPAFAFRLDMLDGSKFDLAAHKGRVVVLDFWATWCGPCMQAMPQVDGLVREFAERNVELIAVNLEEQPAQIKSALERHKLHPTVALDRDGAVAARYGVTAIPQTVVIDRTGKVVRVFVGGGKDTIEALKKVLQELSADQPAPR
jgi:thiol-disulfide isomerase/thioredoxin